MDFKERSTLGGAPYTNWNQFRTSIVIHRFIATVLFRMAKDWPHSSSNINKSLVLPDECGQFVDFDIVDSLNSFNWWMLPDECGQSLAIRNRTVAIKRWITPEVLNCRFLLVRLTLSMIFYSVWTMTRSLVWCLWITEKRLTVDHELLLKKLEAYGIVNQELRWRDDGVVLISLVENKQFI